MRLRLRQGCAFDIGEQPNDTSLATRIGDGRESISIFRENYPRKLAMRQIFREMFKSTRLHVDERLLARGMHDFQDKSAFIIRSGS